MLITNPEDEHEISGPALFRFLLNEETLEEFKVAETNQNAGRFKNHQQRIENH
jgi:hypothetical protein